MNQRWGKDQKQKNKIKKEKKNKEITRERIKKGWFYYQESHKKRGRETFEKAERGVIHQG